MENTKLWTKDFVIVSMENFFAYFTYYLLIATIEVYAVERFHASPSTAGLAAGIFIIGTLLGRLFSGRSIDQVGRKKMLLIGFICFLITTLLYFVVSSLALLILVRILHGAAFGMTSTATGTIVADIIPHERRGEGIGYYALSTTIAAAIGPFLGIFVIQHTSFTINFVICMIVLAISFLAAFLLKIPKVALTSNELKQMNAWKWENFFESKAIPISIVCALIAFSYSSILSFLTSYSETINLQGVASFFFIAYAIAILASRPFTGRWFDEYGENPVMYPTFFLFFFGLLLLGVANQGVYLLLAGVLVGLGYGNFLSNAQAIAIKVSPEHRMGLATSTFFIFADGGVGLGPFLLGLLIPAIGYRGLYISMSLVALVCVLLYYFLHGRKAGHVKHLHVH
ncbi:MAG TPA: MFS transporter [Candidatus Angelobacter sp.]|nr:MFS transporter [Candidatus Angelobacter sp.]